MDEVLEQEVGLIKEVPLVLQQHLEAWERYLDHDNLDFLLLVAVVPAQFELLQPFKDGNGRIGRILIPLFLYQKKHSPSPCSISVNIWKLIGTSTTSGLRLFPQKVTGWLDYLFPESHNPVGQNE